MLDLKSTTVIHVVLSCLLFFGLAACDSLPRDQAHFAKGLKAYEKGDFYTALLYLKPLVEEGNPAAQLLMAKMYANGEGVPEDMGKSELLRNLAAVQIYNKPHAPGVYRPANSSLKAISDRVDYMADGGAASKAMPMQDVSQLLTTLDLGAIKRMAATDFEATGSPSSPKEEAPDIVAPEVLPQIHPESLPQPSEQAPVVRPSAPEVPSAPQALDLSHARDTNHISLSVLLQSAAADDPLAMELLSTAYAKGYYGLTPDPHKAAQWKAKARATHRSSPSSGSTEAESDEALPLYHLGIVGAVGLTLLGGGLWLGIKRGRRRIS